MVQLLSSSKTPNMSKTKTPKKMKAAAGTPKINKKAVKEAACIPEAVPALKAAKMKKTAVKGCESSLGAAVAAATLEMPKVVKVTSKKEAKITPKIAVPQSLVNGTTSGKKSKKSKTIIQKLIEDVEMASESEEEVVSEASPVKAQPSLKKVAKKGKKVKTSRQKQSEDVEIAFKGEEEVTAPAASPVKEQPPLENATQSNKENDSNKDGIFGLFVSDVNFKSQVKHLRAHFEQFGTLTRCFMPRNPNKEGINKGFCFINYTSQEAMNKALATTHALDGRTLRLRLNDNAERTDAGKRMREEADQAVGDQKRPRTTEAAGGRQKLPMVTFDHELFVNQLNCRTTRDTLRDHFSQFGELIKIGLPMKNSSENKGFAFVAFNDASSLQKALADQNQEIDSKKVYLRQKEGQSAAKVVTPRPNELFVGNLNFDTLKETIEQHFSKYGELANVALSRSKEHNRNKGYAFVSFQSADSLAQALEEDHEIDGRVIKIRNAKRDQQNGAASQKATALRSKAALSDDEEAGSDEADSDEEAESVAEEEGDDDGEEAESDDESEQAEEEDQEDEDDEAATDSNDDDDDDEAESDDDEGDSDEEDDE